MCHPQKRVEIKKALEATMGRILELKDVLVRIDGTEFVHLDDILTDLKITPDNLEIAVPR